MEVAAMGVKYVSAFERDARGSEDDAPASLYITEALYGDGKRRPARTTGSW